jgi:DNA-binding TFAR19-related protein (PDSD5 family)
VATPLTIIWQNGRWTPELNDVDSSLNQIERRRTHGNQRNHSEDKGRETHEQIFEDGSNHRIEIMMENLTEITRSRARMKRVQGYIGRMD